MWRETRKRVWERDGGECQSPIHEGDRQTWDGPDGREPLTLRNCHIDHIHSGKRSGNEMGNLRVLCPRCHVLRADMRHRGMMASALRKGWVPANWRTLVWSEGDA